MSVPMTCIGKIGKGRGKSKQQLYAALNTESTSTEEWMWDSGASVHVGCDRRWFTNLATCTPQTLHGYTRSIHIAKKGTVAFTVAGELYEVSNVWYAPGAVRNLISASQSACQAETSWAGDLE